ncbi:Uncharacterised protein [Mycobacteroides abscessus]|nr:Uncharacterised protein [Mycobacteroides abscessus]
MYLLVRELAASGAPVTVTCRVLQIAHAPSYLWWRWGRCERYWGWASPCPGQCVVPILVIASTGLCCEYRSAGSHRRSMDHGRHPMVRSVGMRRRDASASISLCVWVMCELVDVEAVTVSWSRLRLWALGVLSVSGQWHSSHLFLTLSFRIVSQGAMTSSLESAPSTSSRLRSLRQAERSEQLKVDVCG